LISENTDDGDDDKTDDEKTADSMTVSDLEKFLESAQATDNFFDWIKAANYSYDSGNWENAKQYYIRALELCNGEKEQQQLRLICLNRIGEIAIKLDQVDAAFPILEYFSAQTKKQTRATGFILNVAIVVFAVFTLCSLNLPIANLIAAGSAKSNNELPKLIAPSEFKTADQRVVFQIAPDNVYMWNHGKSWKSKYVTASYTFQDLLKLLRGWSQKKENFVFTGSDYLIDQNGLIYYHSKAPEVEIVHQMWFYQGLFSTYYAENKHYPLKEEAWMRALQGFCYANPFTGKEDIAKFVLSTELELSPPTVARPGVVLIFTSGKNTCTICGYDRNGQLLSSGRPGKSFLVQLEDGKILDSEDGLPSEEIREPDTAETILFINDPTIRSVLLGAKYFLPTLAFPILFASLAISLFFYRVFLRSPGRGLAFTPLVAPTLLIVIIVFMFFGN
jgi:hypothetical protein